MNAKKQTGAPLNQGVSDAVLQMMEQARARLPESKSVDWDCKRVTLRYRPVSASRGLELTGRITAGLGKSANSVWPDFGNRVVAFDVQGEAELMKDGAGDE
ncbi:hypothetical protein [Arthrobacter sp. RCC_34]|uniref:hypothetical protein n=1 Tax=Arthrobacter sp. RCC_34 TaxID=3239230 RepID=UPI00352505F7